MEPNDMRDAYSAFGRVVNMAIRAARFSATAHKLGERDRTDALAESSTLVRVVATLIDPHIYEGRRYALLTGNKVWGVLFSRVHEVIEHAATFDEYDEGAVRAACYALESIATEWNESQRESLIRETRQPNKPTEV